MIKKSVIQKTALISVVAMSMFVSACSSSDDDATVADPTTDVETGTTDTTDGNVADVDTTDDNTTEGDSQFNPNLQTVSLLLDSTSTVPAANVDGASGEGGFSVDTSTGAVAGSVTVTGTSGEPTVAHIHTGAAGEAGGAIVALVGTENNTVWSTPENATLDAAGIDAFSAGNLYVNVHTAANPAGELRSQLVDANTPAAGSITITFTNTSEFQPMTPPVVALHNAPDADNGIRLFEVGQTAIGEVVMIAEDGNNAPLVDVVSGQVAAGTVSAFGVGFADPENPGPLLPGASASVNLQVELPDQVLSVVAMVVCTNDGFSGIDSRPLSDDETETFFAPIYDAGSETNVLTLNYWVPQCGGEGNIGDDENGSITAHPGQDGSENPDFDFAAGTELLEITVTRN